VSESFVLRGVSVLDEAGGFEGPLDVHVAAGRVAAVGRDLDAPGAAQHDFAGLWLMPGVFDCHNHVAASSLDAAELLRTPVTLWTLQAAENARRSLEAGVTFIRDPGGADAGIRAAFERGLVPAPGLQIAVVTLCQTGGHADGFLPGAGLEISADYAPPYPGRPPHLVDGPDGMRQAVREVLRAGADWIKLCTTGGVVSAHDDGDVAELTPEELAVAVYEAGRKGKPVMAHAFGGEGLDNAVSAGVRSIEHGMFLTEEQAARMAQAGCWLVPTLLILEEVIGWAKEGLLPPHAEPKALALEPRLGDAVRIAREHGVKLALGSDFVHRDQHGRNLEELPLLVRAGLTPEEALLAATASGAELCGLGATHGRIARGYVFDAIVLDEDPGDLSLFARPGAVTGVFKGGEAVVAHPRLADARPRSAPAPA
jgi:imidazolonepropionase-like amidohydrolase